MLQISGSQAISAFRVEKLLIDVQTNLPHIHVSKLVSEFQHFVDINGELGAEQHQVLSKLLTYGPKRREAKNNGQLILVLPRVGTISPWSTKATNIANNTGLSNVKRLERGIAWYVEAQQALNNTELMELAALLHDPMVESVVFDFDSAQQLFIEQSPKPLTEVDVLDGGRAALDHANQTMGLALSDDEIEYLVEQYTAINKNPTDVELMMFAQVNSEHCRHKIFNADWIIDGKEQINSLFGMIRNTHKLNSEGTLVAYSDNSSVLAGSDSARLMVDADSKQFDPVQEPVHILCKVETHNHPTAISPFSGAATGSGGEIRDEGATGRGSKPKAGLAGFSVSNLRIPGAEQPWENPESKPDRIASSLQIMLDGPIGGAAFNNEFGRPNISGYFRTFEQQVNGETRGYHKPIMLAGGMGNIREQHVEKNTIPDGAHIIVLGGPAMLIGLGGGAASSVSTGASSEDLDFASVQRGNPEMQRRCQEVIDTCTAMGKNNPIVSIHDIGAGGLCNALPELVGDAGKGGHFQLRDVLSEEPGMTPMQIWCNEAQERYTLAVMPEDLDTFKAICERERCLYCVVGEATDQRDLVLDDIEFANGSEREQKPIDLPMDLLFGKPPKMLRNVASQKVKEEQFDETTIDLKEALYRVLQLPSVADKTFLISIGDRSVTGMICRDQMVGKWQVPVADVAVTASSYEGVTGEAMSIGERTPLASINGPASGRMAIGEALTNMAASSVRSMSEIKLSANWMAAANHPGDDAQLYATVKTVGMEICPQLGISIPVGKDSMSMKTVWQDRESKQNKSVTAPVSLIVSAFAPVDDVSKTVTPALHEDFAGSELLFLDIAQGKTRLSLSALAQVFQQVGTADECPDVDDSAFLKSSFEFIQAALKAGFIKAYHDRSDGGLAATLLEMSFASRCGLDIELPESFGHSQNNRPSSPAASLFNEELGAVLQVSKVDKSALMVLATEHGVDGVIHTLGQATDDEHIVIKQAGKILLQESRIDCHRAWSATSYEMQKLRDNPSCAQEEYDRLLDVKDTGLHSELSFDVNEDITTPFIQTNTRPKIAILREQGVNGQMEMAAAFRYAGFDAIDVTMSDLMAGRASLADFNGLAACGGFSYGDVLGAGEGWAKTVLYNTALRDQFSAYFEREDAFTLGICNGCQMVSNLKEIIPGTEHWPHFVKNKSEQYEARVIQAEVQASNSVLLSGMAGSSMPLVVAHGEGRAEFSTQSQLDAIKNQVAIRYVDSAKNIANQYPANPNGSPEGIAGLCNDDGRVTIMMPHPERIFRTVANSWSDESWGEYSPWMRLFRNARVWLC